MSIILTARLLERKRNTYIGSGLIRLRDSIRKARIEVEGGLMLKITDVKLKAKIRLRPGKNLRFLYRSRKRLIIRMTIIHTIIRYLIPEQQKPVNS